MKLAVADYEESCTFDPSEPPRTPSPALQAQAHFSASLHTNPQLVPRLEKKRRKKVSQAKMLVGAASAYGVPGVAPCAKFHLVRPWAMFWDTANGSPSPPPIIPQPTATPTPRSLCSATQS